MAYSAPPTKSVGDHYTASDWNTYMRDNMAAMAPDAFAAKGDIYVASGADAGVRLAVGSDFQQLQARAGATNGVEWSGPVGCLLYNASASAGLGATATVSFTTETVDNSGFHDNVTNPTRITIPAGYGGNYRIEVSGYWDYDSGGSYKFEWVLKNAGAVPIMGNTFTPYGSASIYGYKSCSSIQTLVAGDYLELQIKQGTGGSLAFKEIKFSCFMVR